MSFVCLNVNTGETKEAPTLRDYFTPHFNDFASEANKNFECSLSRARELVTKQFNLSTVTQRIIPTLLSGDFDSENKRMVVSKFYDWLLDQPGVEPWMLGYFSIGVSSTFVEASFTYPTWHESTIEYNHSYISIPPVS